MSAGRLTYKKKNKILLAAGIIFLLAAWQLSISKTIDVYNEVKQQRAQSELASSAPAKVAILEKKLKEMSILPAQQDTSNIQQALLEMITAYCRENNIVLREFPRTIHNKEKDLIVETNVFTVDGSFSKLLSLVYKLEQRNRIGNVSSARFFTRKDPKTKMLSLNATIYIQNIKTLSNEE